MVAALEDQVISMCDDRHHHQEWPKFLRAIDDIVPQDKQIQMIVDSRSERVRTGMVDKCANPRCDEPLVYLRSGVLYAVDVRANPQMERTTHFFWICEPCSFKYKLLFDDKGQPNVVPITHRIFPYKSEPANSRVQRIFINRHLSTLWETANCAAIGLNLIRPGTPTTLGAPEPRKQCALLLVKQRNCA